MEAEEAETAVSVELLSSSSMEKDPMADGASADLSSEHAGDGVRVKTSSGIEADLSTTGSTRTGTSISADNTLQPDRMHKIGHRRVNEDGQVTYKKKPTSELMAAIQLGIGQSITSLSTKPKRDLLLQDFTIVETVFFPKDGSSQTPAHQCSDFRFKAYAPIAFRYFKELFGIQPHAFLLSLCNYPLRELSNPGASGSIFYITDDDEFIIKTVQHKEAEFLQKLLPGYYMNLNQNPRTLLPKFYGLYCYECSGKNIRFVVMNNLLPSSIKLHEKYDLKGSTYKRKASKQERAKTCPTLKDLDYRELHTDGIMLEAETFSALLKTMDRDCRVLQSFQIMDYSLLMGVHNLDQAVRERQSKTVAISPASSDLLSPHGGLTRGRSVHQRLAQFSTTMEAIQARSEPLEIDDEEVPPGGIPARNSKGERLLLYIGIIDILQSYRLVKKLEHTVKSIVHDGDSISVHRPGFYSQRFLEFSQQQVFKKVPSLDQMQVKGQHVRFKKLVQIALKHSTAMNKASVGNQKECEKETEINSEVSQDGRPDVLPETLTSVQDANILTVIDDSDIRHDQSSVCYSSHNTCGSDEYLSLNSYSVSTPTHTECTEGIPSYTVSSPSISSEILAESTPLHFQVSGQECQNSHSIEGITEDLSSLATLKEVSGRLEEVSKNANHDSDHDSCITDGHQPEEESVETSL